jgi:EAL domain-containing protein (putative c-di-GMP-specific phosphodiesterase class I)
MPDPPVVLDENAKGRALVSASAAACGACKDGVEQPFPFSMAFQPIVNVSTGKVFAYEALVRGSGSETNAAVMSNVTPENLYAFDQSCRVKAITLAARLGLAETGALLSINFIPGAVYSPAACLRLTLETADKVGFPTNQLIFEVTEREKVQDIPHLQGIINEYRRRGFRIALDDMGAAFSGLGLLSDLPVDIIKLDKALTHHLNDRAEARAIVSSMISLSEKLGVQLIAEGVEMAESYHVLRELGVSLMQGYLLARPAYEALPEFTLPG